MVMVLPIYEEEQTGVYYNTAVVVDADGTILGQVPQAPHPAPREVLGEVLLPPRQPRLPGLRHRGRQGRRLHLLRPALPRGLARARPQRRAHGLQPQRHQARACPTGCGRSRARAPRSPTATSCCSPTGSAARTTSTATRRSTSTAPARSSTRAATSSASAAPRENEELLVRDLDLDMVQQMRDDWQFYRDRRPDSYTADRAGLRVR